MVEVVQLVERQIVVLVVAGSSPVFHPNFRDVVQLVECLVWDQEVRGFESRHPDRFSQGGLRKNLHNSLKTKMFFENIDGN